MRQKAALILLTVALFAGIAVYLSSKYVPVGPGVQDVVQQQEAGAQRALSIDSASGEQTQATSESTSKAKNKRQEAYTILAEKLSAPENTLKRDVFIDQAGSRLEAVKSEVILALQGDDAAARKLLTRARECRQFNPMTLLDIETEIAYYRERFNRSRGADDQRREQSEQRIEKTRAAMQARVENCSWRHTGEFPDLRAQVERQAESGNVLARFYYAMLLKPSPYEVNYLLETAAWSDNALRFTMENINQNMTSGYLALSFSHAQGIFTHQDARLAGIWAFLVMSCPMNGPIATPYLDTLLSNDRLEYLSGTTVDIGQVWARQVCKGS